MCAGFVFLETDLTNFANDLRRVTHDSRARGHVARDQRAGFNERARADTDAFEDGCVRANPDIVLNGYGPFRNLRPRTALAERRAGYGVGDALGRLERMKIRVGNCRIPANDDVIADAHFQFAKQNRVGEIAVVPDLHPALFSEREMDAVHRAVGADDQRVRFVAAKAFKREIAGDERVRAEANIGRWHPWRLNGAQGMRRGTGLAHRADFAVVSVG